MKSFLLPFVLTLMGIGACVNAAAQCDLTLSVTHPSCLPTGAVIVKAPVGPDFTYSIDGTLYQSSPYFPGLAPGTHTVYVRNSDNTCTASAEVTLSPENCDYSICNSNLYWNDSSGNIGTFNVKTYDYDVVCSTNGTILGDIAVDMYGHTWAVGVDSDSLYLVDMDACSLTPVAALPFSSPNSLSALPDGTLLIGSGSHSTVARYNPATDDVSAWHDVGSGSPNGDFIFLNGYVYILWFDADIDESTGHIYRVEVDEHYNYISHIDLGGIARFSYGLAKVNGELYAATASGFDPNPGAHTGTIIKIPLPDVANWSVVHGDNTSYYYGATSPQEPLLTEAPFMSNYNVIPECPQTTVDLSALVTAASVTGMSVRWFTNDTHTGTPLSPSEIANAGAGEYYAFYYDAVEDCYGIPSRQVVIQTCVTLPVTLGGFTATKKNNTALLEWSTFSEQNNRGFEVLRSTDGAEWSKLGFVNSKVAGDISSAMLPYSFTDDIPVKGINYYRLRQLDVAGSFKYSSIVFVKFDDIASELSVYPSLADASVTVAGLKGASTIRVINAMGQVVRTVSTTGELVREINLAHLPGGMYYIQVASRKNVVTVKRIVKQ